ncbi:MAG: hypothetical protein PUH24_07910 [Prevotellaceae bacterium]|nr:hypothetical protein [Prevotella sp.]MDD7258174.1 hypothetical protein [Prevotellaceae bacterium]MDY6130274.1 hypothetical protein [Prevotella sp.]
MELKKKLWGHIKDWTHFRDTKPITEERTDNLTDNLFTIPFFSFLLMRRLDESSPWHFLHYALAFYCTVALWLVLRVFARKDFWKMKMGVWTKFWYCVKILLGILFWLFFVSHILPEGCLPFRDIWA